MKVIKIPDRKYYRKIYLIKDFTFEEMKKYFQKKYPKAEDLYHHNGDYHFFSVINDQEGVEDFYVCVKNFNWRIPDLGLLSHEVLHLVFLSLQRIGIKYSENSEEAFTYYFDGILQNFMEALRPRQTQDDCKKKYVKEEQ